MYIVDYGNSRIRKVTVATDIISTIAGTGVDTYNGDGIAATSAALQYPTGIALDSSGRHYRVYHSRELTSYVLIGNVYIADRTNFRVRKVTVSTGIITTIAGGGGSGGYSGDGGAATSAALACPYAVALDSAGSDFF